MTEKQIKFLCKWIVENSNRPLSKVEKEVIKQAIDQAKSIEDLLALALASIGLTDGR